MLMLTRETAFGYIVWLEEEEISCKEVEKEINKLKNLGHVAIFCSGSQASLQIISKLLQENMKPELL